MSHGVRRLNLLSTSSSSLPRVKYRAPPRRVIVARHLARTGPSSTCLTASFWPAAAPVKAHSGSETRHFQVFKRSGAPAADVSASPHVAHAVANHLRCVIQGVQVSYWRSAASGWAKSRR